MLQVLTDPTVTVKGVGSGYIQVEKPLANHNKGTISFLTDPPVANHNKGTISVLTDPTVTVDGARSGYEQALTNPTVTAEGVRLGYVPVLANPVTVEAARLGDKF